MVANRFAVLSLCYLGLFVPAVGRPHDGTDDRNPDRERREIIVYTTLRPPNWDIYLFEQPGKPPRRLTDDPALDYNATFSPDGKWLVFTSERRGNADLYALEIDKKDAKPIALTSHEAMDDAATISPDGTTIAFVSTRDGNADIFSMPFDPGNPDAEKKAKNLTRHPHGDFNPAFSPDGKHIAFVRGEQTLTRVHIMSADGGNVRPVVKDGLSGGTPTWSADSQNIYFYSAVDLSKSLQIIRCRLDGTQIKRMLPDSITAFSPAVMVDGRIAFARGPDLAPGDLFEIVRPWGKPRVDLETLTTNTRIWSVDADGKDLRQESDAKSYYAAPRFDRKGRMVCHGPGPVDGLPLMKNGNPFVRPSIRSQHKLPDGRIVEVHAVRGYFPSLGPKGDVVHTPWVHPKNYGLPQIAICNLDGTNMRYLDRPKEALPWATILSRDGQWIYFSLGAAFGGPKDNCEIWKMRPDGSGAKNLTPDDKSNNAFPDVSADGKTIVFRSHRDGNKEIYLMDADGANVRRLTNDPSIDTMPAISPDGKWVVFSKGKTENVSQLYMMRIDIEEKGQYLEPDRAGKTGNDMHARFSPDGKWLVFVSNRSGLNDEYTLTAGNPQPNGELWALPVKDGKATGKAIRLTHDKWEDGLPYWGYAPK